jgi:lipopolysaccharide transport system permease protein
LFAPIKKYRELIYFLVRSDVVTRYKQTVLGPAWVIVEPVIEMVVFTVVFGKIHETEVENIHVAYPVFLYAGLLPWTFFRSTLTKGANSLVVNRDLVQRVFFPREILVSVHVFSGLFDFGISFLVLLALMIGFGVPIRWSILAIIPLLGGVCALVLGLSFWLSVVNARYRDVRQMVPFVLQVLMYLSPVIYPPDFLPPESQWLLALNPMTGYLEAFRSVIIGTHWEPTHVAVSMVFSGLVLLVGWWYFRHKQLTVADVL